MDTTERLYETFRRHGAVSTDSRRIEPGCVFFALRGENFDGNRYAAGALEAGAAAAVVDDPAVAADPRCFLVPDALVALQELAAYHRTQLGIPILAITGSSGKTTTKELIWRVLSRKFRTSVTQGNLNNHIGVPLTLLAMDAQTQFGVVEMGASHCGEIALLSRITSPDFGLITNVGLAHLEGFGGPEGVRRGKGELFDHLLAHGGTAFYLQDDPVLAAMAAERPGLKKIPYSATALPAKTTPQGLRVRWKNHEIKTHLIGEYNVNNLSAAIAVGEHFEIPSTEIAEALESFIPDNNRSQRSETARNTLILDAYNANPSSMRAALDTFIREESPRPKAVILGEMGELGSYAPEAHKGIVSLLQEGGLTEVYLVGEAFIHAAADHYPTFPNVTALCDHLHSAPLSDRLILIKGSRTNHLEHVVETL